MVKSTNNNNGETVKKATRYVKCVLPTLPRKDEITIGYYLNGFANPIVVNIKKTDVNFSTVERYIDMPTIDNPLIISKESLKMGRYCKMSKNSLICHQQRCYIVRSEY